MRDAIDLTGGVLAFAALPAFGGALFAVFGKALFENAFAPGSSTFRQYAHFWVAGMVLWAVVMGGAGGGLGIE